MDVFYLLVVLLGWINLLSGRMFGSRVIWSIYYTAVQGGNQMLHAANPRWTDDASPSCISGGSIEASMRVDLLHFSFVSETNSDNTRSLYKTSPTALQQYAARDRVTLPSLVAYTW